MSMREIEYEHCSLCDSVDEATWKGVEYFDVDGDRVCEGCIDDVPKCLECDRHTFEDVDDGTCSKCRAEYEAEEGEAA